MAGPFPRLNLNGNPLPGIPWTEFISNHGGVAEGTFGYEGGNQVTMSFIVYEQDEIAATVTLLGSQDCNRVNGNIDRILPARHPKKYWLYCSRVNAKPFRWRGQELGATGGACSNYDFSLITAVFTQPKYPMFTDNDLQRLFAVLPGGIRQEWRRFVEFIPQTGSETISRDAGQFKYAEGGPGGANPAVGDPFPSPVPQQLAKGDWTLLWRKVPLYAGLLSSQSGLPDNLLLASTSPVNSAPFLGAPTGTVRFNGARIIPQESPFPPNFNGILAASGLPQLVADVEISVSYWDPPHGGPSRGHNLAPRADAVGGLNNWFLITTDGNPGSDGVYKTSDLNNIFILPG